MKILLDEASVSSSSHLRFAGTLQNVLLLGQASRQGHGQFDGAAFKVFLNGLKKKKKKNQMTTTKTNRTAESSRRTNAAFRTHQQKGPHPQEVRPLQQRVLLHRAPPLLLQIQQEVLEQGAGSALVHSS